MGPQGPEGPQGEPGPAGSDGLRFKFVRGGGEWTNTPGTDLLSSSLFSISADLPTSGVAYVIASGTCTAPTGSAIRLGLAANENMFPLSSEYAHVQPTTATGQVSFSVVGISPIVEAANRTFYLNSYMESAPDGAPEGEAQTYTCSGTLTLFFGESELP
jgi:hypothetical protein